MGNWELVDGLDSVEYFLAYEELLKAIETGIILLILDIRKTVLTKRSQDLLRPFFYNSTVLTKKVSCHLVYV